MSELKDFIHCYENILDLKVCQQIIAASEKLDFTRAGTQDGEITEHRKCYTREIGKESESYIFKGVGKVLEKYSECHHHFHTGNNLSINLVHVSSTALFLLLCWYLPV